MENQSPFFKVWHALANAFSYGQMTAAAQLIGFNLLIIFNERHFPAYIEVSDRELMAHAQVTSKRAFTDAKRRLKNEGLFDFKTRERKPTIYTLGEIITKTDK